MLRKFATQVLKKVFLSVCVKTEFKWNFNYNVWRGSLWSQVEMSSWDKETPGSWYSQFSTGSKVSN